VDQITEEIMACLDFINFIYINVFGFSFKLFLSTRPEDGYLGDIESWNLAESKLKDALDGSGYEWSLNPGDGAFYGPKVCVYTQNTGIFLFNPSNRINKK
jgi:threonyl-tRNA synthetase